MSLPTAINALPERAPEYLALLESWASINSGSGNLPGLERMRAALRAEFAARWPGAAIEEVPLPGTTAQALHVTMRPDAATRLFLNGHYDTVFEADHPFQRCTHLETNTLGGPGVADMKGGIVVMLAALVAFEQTPAAGRVGWEILLTPDEESGSAASSHLFNGVASRCGFGLVFEPARPNGDLVRSRKGTGAYTIVCHGRAAHAAVPSAGRNAIVALAGLVQALSRVPDELPGVLLNVGCFTGGSEATNIVPDRAEILLDVRITRRADLPAVEQRLRELVTQADQAEGFHFQLSGGFNRPPKESGPVEEAAFAGLQNAAVDLGLESFSWVHSGGGSDSNFLSEAGLPNLDGVGIIGGRLHTDGEYVLIDSLIERAQLAALFLHRVATGELVLPTVTATPASSS
jgi:glutamate carboxypeptidase